MYEKECPYCNLLADPEQQIIFENATCAYIQKPSEQTVLEGSGLIVPKRHAVDVFSLTAQEWIDTQELLMKVKAYLEERYGHDGYSVGWNTGKTGGQSISHAHLHVIPRFADEPYAGKGIRHWIKQEANHRRV
ncbi:HIT domain-containing protein [Sporosarcina sp. FSL K6-1540]|uniref:HIT family protein n=1 Tax=Sporosarcina TaxID=1569 RepID=UPI00078E2CBE|nr:HIT domain-containing protein [Sporosarcina psychrophila]AMQ04868.1 cell-cycle regulation histidine triad HIT protein [Sporosarcina psychrophila]